MSTSASITLPVTIFQEDGSFVAYTPALDLSTAAPTEAEAKRMFGEAVHAFFEELTEAGTLFTVLQELGWTIDQGHPTPPKVIEHRMMDIRVASL